MTGASGGIGSAIKKLLLENGYKVSTIGRGDAQIVCDLKDSKLLAKEVEKWLKTNAVDILINAAGFGLFDPLESTKPEKID
jgi:short-subunit dehydrogenase